MDGPVEPISNSELVGQPLGDYMLIRHLGSGGMADVYLASQVALDRLVAIKVLKRELAADANYVRRFANEARSIAALTHQNIVQVYEVGAHEGCHFIAQEYVAGRNLKQHLQRQAALPIPDAVTILRAVASALACSSKAGIVHRDIKPENILLGDGGEVKVADFGLARRDQSSSQLELTQIGMTVGTPLYMSPEQFHGNSLDAKSDIYSLGVTAYHMLAGYPPFDGETAIAVAMQHVNDEPPSLTDLRPDVSVQLSSLVRRMMEKNPDDRFADFPELLKSLDAIKPGEDAARNAAARTHHSGVAQPLSAATRELAAVVGATPRVSRLSSWIPFIAAAALGGLLAMGLTLTAGRGDPIAMRAGESLPPVERKVSAQAQYAYAMFVNTEQAWRAVLEYFPADSVDAGPRQRLYALNAKRQLARFYFDQGEPNRALPLCTELAELDSTEGSLRAFGLAGQAIAYFRMDKRKKAANALSSIEGERGNFDRATRNELNEIRRALSSD